MEHPPDREGFAGKREWLENFMMQVNKQERY